MTSAGRRFGHWGIAGVSIAAMLVGADMASAHKVKTKDLVVSHPWVRAVPGGLQVTAGYMRIENKGVAADRLIAVSADFAASAELHQMLVTADGVAEMRPVTEGLEIPAGGTVELKPSGVHIMFMGLKTTLQTDTYEPGTLTFAKAGTIAAEFFVQPITATAPAHNHTDD